MEQGKFYHVFNRGINKQPIFFEEENYYFFLRRMDLYLSEWVDMYSYCLMPNHFHLFLSVKDVFPDKLISKKGGFGQIFKNFFISYAKAINERYSRTGALFQQKFKKKEVDNDAYFSSIIQYIHLNPTKAKLCDSPSDWKFSSYPAIVSDVSTKIKRNEVLEWFGGKDQFIKIHKESIIDCTKMERYLFGKG